MITVDTVGSLLSRNWSDTFRQHVSVLAMKKVIYISLLDWNMDNAISQGLKDWQSLWHGAYWPYWHTILKFRCSFKQKCLYTEAMGGPSL